MRQRFPEITVRGFVCQLTLIVLIPEVPIWSPNYQANINLLIQSLIVLDGGLEDLAARDQACILRESLQAKSKWRPAILLGKIQSIAAAWHLIHRYLQMSLRNHC